MDKVKVIKNRPVELITKNTQWAYCSESSDSDDEICIRRLQASGQAGVQEPEQQQAQSGPLSPPPLPRRGQAPAPPPFPRSRQSLSVPRLMGQTRQEIWITRQGNLPSTSSGVITHTARHIRADQGSYTSSRRRCQQPNRYGSTAETDGGPGSE